jgi:hypothetical protein
MDAAFQTEKCVLICASILSHSDPAAMLSWAGDASCTHVGRILQQLPGSHWSLWCYSSTSCPLLKKRYSTFHQELLATFLAICRFRFVVEDRAFTLFKDPLLRSGTTSPSLLSTPQAWCTRDALPRPGVGSLSLTVTVAQPAALAGLSFATFAEAQASCAETTVL